MLEGLSHRLADGIPPGWGFTLLIFEVDQAAPSVFYVSSASREGTRVALQEFERRLSAGDGAAVDG